MVTGLLLAAVGAVAFKINTVAVNSVYLFLGQCREQRNATFSNMCLFVYLVGLSVSRISVQIFSQNLDGG